MLIPLWIVLSFVYMLLHQLLYATVLRHRLSFRREQTVFLYHLLSAIGCTTLLLAWVTVRQDAEALAVLVGVACLHGIYSLSFLELWSLAEGGYSLQILRHLANPVPGQDLFALRTIGEKKKVARIDGLLRLRLVARKADRMALTPAGQLVAAILRGIGWLTRIGEGG